ncbi:8-oxoguanine DNA glycosylase, partial [Candidatus Woesearchaeota archaeon]|nr:8-oxoguanine DNA glycosylase [Candidatus Woesearchaeota archaeon]
MQKIKTKNFSLEHTLECGQVFRYFKRENGFYFLVVRDKIVKLRQEGNDLYFKGVPESFIKKYFRLDDNYEKIISELKKDKNVAKAIEKYPGLHLCRQDPWECLVSYICSAASNIPKIQRNIENLAESFGKEISLEGFKTHAFPSPAEIKDLCTIKSCGCGFRSPYIFETAKKITEKELAGLEKIGYQDAKKYLMGLPGVGEKVADCVLLFSLGFDEAFPVDVWVKRIMEKLYFSNKKTSEKKIRELAKEKFGKYAGYAQQF